MVELGHSLYFRERNIISIFQTVTSIIDARYQRFMILRNRGDHGRSARLPISIDHRKLLPEIAEHLSEQPAGIGDDEGDIIRVSNLVNTELLGQRAIGEDNDPEVLDKVFGQGSGVGASGYVGVQFGKLLAAYLGPVLSDVAFGDVELRGQVIDGAISLVMEGDGLNTG